MKVLIKLWFFFVMNPSKVKLKMSINWMEIFFFICENVEELEYVDLLQHLNLPVGVSEINRFMFLGDEYSWGGFIAVQWWLTNYCGVLQFTNDLKQWFLCINGWNCQCYVVVVAMVFVFFFTFSWYMWIQ